MAIIEPQTDRPQRVEQAQQATRKYPAEGKKKISLALQGGGSHGAFTWGVLERFLEDGRVHMDAFCGTSAGAMNAAVAAYGIHQNGRQGALELLERFWRAISRSQRFSLLQPSLLDKRFNSGRLDYSPAYLLFDMYSLVFSPYQFNPLDINPLRQILLELIDFEALRTCECTKLFVCATNVRTTRAKVFNMREISADAVLASACLPYLFKAVEIEGEAYWDGGFMGNPPIFPLIDKAEAADIVLIQINPIEIDYIPKTADEIRNRANEISFNASLMHEMRRVNFVQKMLARGMNLENKLRDLRIHAVAPTSQIAFYGASSKLNADWSFIRQLRKQGHAAADEWLEKNFDKIGKESTCDVQEEFL